VHSANTFIPINTLTRRRRSHSSCVNRLNQIARSTPYSQISLTAQERHFFRGFDNQVDYSPPPLIPAPPTQLLHRLKQFIDMYYLTIPFVVLSFVSHVHSRYIDASVVPVNLIRHQRRGIDQSVLLENGQEAQKLNAKFATMDSNSQCSTGDSACISGGFSQCVGGKFVGGPCAQGSKCFALREFIL
jgi:hypothetical protein